MEPMKKARDGAGFRCFPVDVMLLLGGTNELPIPVTEAIEQLVKDYFNGIQPKRGVNTDEAVAHGVVLRGGGKVRPKRRHYKTVRDNIQGATIENFRVIHLVPGIYLVLELLKIPRRAQKIKRDLKSHDKRKKIAKEIEMEAFLLVRP